MKSSKNIIILILAWACLSLLIDNHHKATEFAKLTNNLDKFDIEFANWDSGETLFWMRGIPGYDIGFALSNDGHVFWHKIGRDYEYFNGFEVIGLTEPGVCSDTPVAKYAFRPAGCFNRKELKAKPVMTDKPACILYDLVNVDRHRL